MTRPEIHAVEPLDLAQEEEPIAAFVDALRASGVDLDAVLLAERPQVCFSDPDAESRVPVP